MSIHRSLRKYLRIAGVAFMVALLSLGGGLNIFLDGISLDVPAAQAQLAGQIGIARPKLIFRESDKQFLVVGENQAQHGVFLQNPNPAGNGACYQVKTDVEYETGTSSKAIRVRAATDTSGNVYMVWMDAPPGGSFGFQVFMRVFNASCTPTSNVVNVSDQLRLRFNASGGGAHPDVAFNPATGRVYLSWQGGIGGGYTQQVLVASAPAGTTGWEGNKWDQFWGLSDAPGTSMEPKPRLVADKSGRLHVIFRRNRGDNQAEVRVIDFTPAGGWNLYGGPGKNISNSPYGASDVTETFDISVSCRDYAFVGWPDRYDIGTVGLSTFDPNVGWNNGVPSVVSTNVGQISTGVAAGRDGNSVFLGQGYSAAQIWSSTNRGQSFSGAANYNYGANVNAITLAQGNNTVGIFTLDANRGNHFHSFAGGGTCVAPIVTQFTGPANGTVVNIPVGQPTAPVTISWDSTGGAGTPVNYYLEFSESQSGGWQGVPGAYPTTAKSIVFNMPGRKTYFFRIRGADGQGGDEAIHPVADIGIIGRYSTFQAVDVVMDASGYYAPNQTPDPNNGNATDRGLLYYPLAKPIRLLDTRAGAEAYNKPGQAIGGNTTQTFTMAGINYAAVGTQIPSAAVALASTVSITGQAGGGYLTAYPGGGSQPLAATMTYGTTTISNYATLLLGNNSVSLYAQTTTHVIIDVAGYFAPPNTPDPNNGNATDRGLAYYALPKPTRLLDTRPGQSAYNTPGTPIATNTSQSYQMAGINYGAVGIQIPSAAQSLVGTLSVVNSVGSGYLTAYPTGGAQPLSANMTYAIPNRILSTTTNLTLGTQANAGKLSIYAFATTDAIVDVTGYYAPPGTADPNNGGATDRGLYYYALPKPIRLLDTRPGQSAYNTPGNAIGSNTAYNLQVAGINYTAVGVQIPGEAKAIDTNSTVVIPYYASGEGYATVYPGPQNNDGSQRPLASSLYYYWGDILSNAGIQTVGPNNNNTINIYVIAIGNNQG